ncbi:MAG: tRNA lysidine(34) synthetase TilS [Clostridiales bacterium]|nr:tRNA lysidine(34) synthetase TilS [Clostridiales bacterium]
MKNFVKAYINDNGMIVRGDTIWVALSGGADSCSLLHLLNDIKTDINFILKAVHINHQLRGDESEGDEKFCRTLCAENGIALSVYNADVKQIAKDKGMTIEQAGRSVRYNIFETKCPGKVAIAHNMNDNVETLLMNLIRGTGTTGMCGISHMTGKYIRPLIKISRASIENYCADNGIKYVTDSSNEDTVYFRNAVRHKILPLMSEITGKDVVPALDRASESIRIDADFINKAADEAYTQYVTAKDGKTIIDNRCARNLHHAVLTRILRRAIESVKGNLTDIEARHIVLIVALLTNNKTGDAVNLPDGVNALVQFGKTIIHKEILKEDYEYLLPIPGKIVIKEKNLEITTEICDNFEKANPQGNVHYFSGKYCKDGFFARNRRNGDIIKPWKGNGTTKLKKYFIDKKVERYTRDSLLLITCNDSVVYIEGMDYGKDFIPSNDEDTIKVIIERR